MKVLPYHLNERRTVIRCRCIKSRDESHAPTVATPSVENGGQPQGDVPEREI